MRKTFFRPATAVLLALIMAIIPLSPVLASGNNPAHSLFALTPGDAFTTGDAFTGTDAPSTETDAPLTPEEPSTTVPSDPGTTLPDIPGTTLPDEPLTPDVPGTTEKPDVPGTTEKPDEPVEPSNSDIVGTISLAFRMSRISFGHVWVYIHNTSDEPFEVGLYTVQPGEGVSLGNFNLTRSDGRGLYYNIESYCGNLYGLNGTVSVSDKLTRGRLNAVSEALKNGNHFDPIYNCTGFALTIWNIGSAKIMPFIPIPLVAMVEILLWGGRFNNLEMSYPPAEQVYKQKGNGKDAYLVPVCEESLSKPV